MRDPGFTMGLHSAAPSSAPYPGFTMGLRAVFIVVALTACSGGAPSVTTGPPTASALVSTPPGSPARIEVRQIDARPRLTLIGRDGDPTPAIVASVVTDLGPAGTTVLAAVVESRLRAAGFDADTRVDRGAFRVRLLVADTARAAGFLGAVASAFARPIAPGSPELALAAQRLTSLKRNPLDAPELVPVAACTGALGIAGNEPLPDLTSAAGARDAEASRAGALTVGRTAIAAVGPAAFCAAVTSALEHTQGFPVGAAAADAWPAGDSFGAYASPLIERRSARVTVAVRVADPHAAAAAAERLGAPDSPLITRLRALPEPFRVIEVTGVARPRGGCVSAVVEAAASRPLTSSVSAALIEPAAALAGALVREEIAAELTGPSGPGVAVRQILTAADPREAASRAAWWALAGPSPGSPERWAFALGLPANNEGAAIDPARQRFQGEIERSLAARAAPVAERRAAVERGQGELWLLLASTCGVAEEGPEDAGHTAVAVVAALEAPWTAYGVTLEPWITADGVGVIARAPLREDGEAPGELARRVADAAARTLSATPFTGELVYTARSMVLDLLERSDGRQGAAMSAFAGAIAPDHPSWLEPFGLFPKVASSGLEGIRLRRRALAEGPLRVAVLANADAAQAEAAGSAVDRWLRPSLGPRTCRAGAPSPARPGHYEAHLPSDAPIAQAVIGAPIAAPARDMADLAVQLLNGDAGLLVGALQQAPAAASARLLGGTRAPALAIDVHAPEGGLASAVSEVKLLLGRLPTTVTDADLTRAVAAVERREREGRADPRRRLIDLWSGRRVGPPPRPTLAALRAFLGEALKEAALVVVEARPE